MEGARHFEVPMHHSQNPARSMPPLQYLESNIDPRGGTVSNHVTSLYTAKVLLSLSQVLVGLGRAQEEKNPISPSSWV